MKSRLRTLWGLAIAWLVISLAGGAVDVQSALDHERAEFVLEAQSLHRALAQQLRQQEQLFVALSAAEQPGAAPTPAEQAALLSAQGGALQWLRRAEAADWPSADRSALALAEMHSQQSGRAASTAPDLAAGHYWWVRRVGSGAVAGRFALSVAPVQGAAEPFAGRSDVRVWLEREGLRHPLVRASSEIEDPGGWRFSFRQKLAPDAWALDIAAVRRLGWVSLPWRGIGAWVLLTSLLALSAAALMVRRRAVSPAPHAVDTLGLSGWSMLDEPEAEPADPRRRAAPSETRPGQASARKPLLVTLRELDVEPPELVVARGAIRQASRQARRTSGVIDGLRRQVEDAGGEDTQIQPLIWDELLGDALDMLQRGCARLGVACHVRWASRPCVVQADPMVLEQLVHLLFAQALRALQQAPVGADHRLDIGLTQEAGWAALSVCNTSAQPSEGSPEWDGNLRLAHSIGGSLTTAASAQLGSVVRLSLPLAG